MLTRIEINGFKTFEDFALDLGPFQVVLGPNGVGKSNLFDAIRLLSRLAEHDLFTAVKELRGDPHELFRRGPDGRPGRQIDLAAEVLIEPHVKDPYGVDVALKHTRIRYEVSIAWRQDSRGIDRLQVVHEKASPILAKEDRWLPGGIKPSTAFKREFMKYSRQVSWLSSEGTGEDLRFAIHQDLRQGRTRPADAAGATVLSSMTSADFPHLFALREELRSWRFLQLDPGALRLPSPTTANATLDPDGANVATVLAHIKAETQSEQQPKGALSDISVDLGSIIPGVLNVDVIEDERSRQYRAVIAVRDEEPFSSNVVSDGTLRVLALLAMLHNPQHHGLVCFEEPENGVHPERLKRLLGRLQELVTDPSAEEVEPEERLSQMLVNSHSPVVLAALADGRTLFADLATVITPGGQIPNTRRTRVRPMQSSDVLGERVSLPILRQVPAASRFEADLGAVLQDLC